VTLEGEISEIGKNTANVELQYII